MTKKKRDLDFLHWAKLHGGDCCVCRYVDGHFIKADELHHFNYRNRGMSVKGSDYWVARLCRDHHKKLQGKGRIYFQRTGDWETFSAMLEDALYLTSEYLERQHERKR